MLEYEAGLNRSEIDLAIRACNTAIDDGEINYDEVRVAEWRGMVRAYQSVITRDEKTIDFLNEHLSTDSQIPLGPLNGRQIDLGLILDAPTRMVNDWELELPRRVLSAQGVSEVFDPGRVERSIGQTFATLGRTPYTPVPELAARVVNVLVARSGVPTTEVIQNAVELVLQAAGEFEAAKVSILAYAEKHPKNPANL